MKAKTMIAARFRNCRSSAGGFTLLEMLCATMILLVALFAIAQLVPASITMNGRNRNDSTALVFAQRELDQMLEQPLSSSTFQDDKLILCNLGDPANPDTAVGNPVVIINNYATMDFTGAPVPGYSFTYQDPNSTNGATLDVRWTVITSVNGGIITSKRFVLGVRQQGGNGFFLPITLDSTVEK